MAAFAEGLERLGLVAHSGAGARRPTTGRSSASSCSAGTTRTTWSFPIYGSGYNAYPRRPRAAASRCRRAASCRDHAGQHRARVRPSSRDDRTRRASSIRGSSRSSRTSGRSRSPRRSCSTRRTRRSARTSSSPTATSSPSGWRRAPTSEDERSAGAVSPRTTSCRLNGGSAFPPVTSLAGNNQFNNGHDHEAARRGSRSDRSEPDPRPERVHDLRDGRRPAAAIEYPAHVRHGRAARERDERRDAGSPRHRWPRSPSIRRSRRFSRTRTSATSSSRSRRS